VRGFPSGKVDPRDVAFQCHGVIGDIALEGDRSPQQLGPGPELGRRRSQERPHRGEVPRRRSDPFREEFKADVGSMQGAPDVPLDADVALEPEGLLFLSHQIVDQAQRHVLPSNGHVQLRVFPERIKARAVELNDVVHRHVVQQE